MNYPSIIAVEFDGTLCETAKYPEIGTCGYYNKAVIEYVKNAKASGSKLVLCTMREGEPLEAALRWCEEKGLTFDAVNDNLMELQVEFGFNPRRIFANMYIGDKYMTPKMVNDALWAERGN